MLIVGGGPGGSSCARRLAAAGLDVVVLDKAAFPRDKVCAGWITPAVVDALGLDTADYARGRVFQPITAFRVGREGGAMIDLEYERPVSYGIRRCEFDHYLLSRCGARLELGQRCQSIQRTAVGWVVNDRFQAPMLVGAGGHFCPVAQWLGDHPTPLARESERGAGGEGGPQRKPLSDSSEPLVAAQEIEFHLDERQQADCQVAAHRPELYFCRDLMGYGWCFRKGDYLNVGLGREDRRGLAEHVAAFCDSLKQQGRIPHDLPRKFHGHAYLLYGHASRHLVDDGVLLIGDAAGLAYAQSGEGIRPAIESGLLAAEAIVEAAGHYARQRLEPYRLRLEKHFGRRRTPPSTVGRAPSAFRQFLGGRLLANRWFVRRMVIERWFLHGASPQFLASAPPRRPFVPPLRSIPRP